MILKPDSSYFIPYMIKKIEAHKYRSTWTLMKKSEVSNKHEKKYEKLKNIL